MRMLVFNSPAFLADSCLFIPAMANGFSRFSWEGASIDTEATGCTWPQNTVLGSMMHGRLQTGGRPWKHRSFGTPFAILTSMGSFMILLVSMFLEPCAAVEIQVDWRGLTQ